MKPEIRSHHAIRGIAALLVLTLHLQEVLKWGGIHISKYTSFIDKGYLWVDCFFILSGFILSYVYGHGLETSKGSYFRSATTAFFVARFARIYPLHLFTLISVLLIRGLGQLVHPSPLKLFWGHNTPESFVTNLLLIHAWNVHDTLTWNIPSWSISTEMFAYLIFPLLCAVAKWVPLLWRFLLPVIPIAGYAILLSVDKNLDQTVHLGLIRCLSGFALGMAVFRLWLALNKDRRQRMHWLQLPAVIGIVLLMHMGTGDLLVVGLFAVLVLSTADDEGIVAAALHKPGIIWLGLVSYSVYMIHFPILYFANQFKWFLFERWVSDGILEAPLLATALFFVLGASMLATSALTYRYVEAPGRRLVRGRRGAFRAKIFKARS